DVVAGAGEREGPRTEGRGGGVTGRQVRGFEGDAGVEAGAVVEGGGLAHLRERDVVRRLRLDRAAVDEKGGRRRVEQIERHDRRIVDVLQAVVDLHLHRESGRAVADADVLQVLPIEHE